MDVRCTSCFLMRELVKEQFLCSRFAQNESLGVFFLTDISTPASCKHLPKKNVLLLVCFEIDILFTISFVKSMGHKRQEG